MTAPAPAFVTVDDHARRQLARIARERSEFRRYSHGKSPWKRGLLADNNASGPAMGLDLNKAERVIFVGLLGEWAVQQYINNRFRRPVASVDWANRQGGDRGVDVSAVGVSLQVKTRTGNYGRTLIRRVDDRRTLQAMQFDIVVSCQSTTPDRVLLLGWLRRKDLYTKKIARTTLNVDRPWWNIDVLDADLRTIRSLGEHLSALVREASNAD